MGSERRLDRPLPHLTAYLQNGFFQFRERLAALALLALAMKVCRHP